MVTLQVAGRKSAHSCELLVDMLVAVFRFAQFIDLLMGSTLSPSLSSHLVKLFFHRYKLLY